jgi:hypothetical protein
MVLLPGGASLAVRQLYTDLARGFGHRYCLEGRAGSRVIRMNTNPDRTISRVSTVQSQPR